MNPNRSTIAREWLLIAAMTLAGATLRFWSFGRLSLSHFDEGIYAFSGLWSISGRGLAGLDPMVIAYAPPGFPILVGLSYLLLGIGDHAAILAATLCGVATIPVVGWLGRRTFGTGGGAGAATFAALSMAHVAFSRKALTDAPFLLAWLVAVGLGARFLERPGPARALALGLAVGLAQDFKYNGWLAGVLVALAAFVGAIVRRDGRRAGPLLRTFGWGLVAALTAAVTYAPWFTFVEAHGGYAALLRHHRSYLGDLSIWWSHWNTQLGMAFALSGARSWGGLTWLLAYLAGAASAYRPGPVVEGTRRSIFISLAQVVLGTALFAFQANLAWWLGLAWFAWLVLSARPSLRLLGIWWLVLTILTPFYHPYARLWLPLHAVGWIIMGGVIASFGPFGQGIAALDAEPWDRRRRSILGVSALTCVILSVLQVNREQPHPLGARMVLEPIERESLRSFVFDGLSDERSRVGKTFRVLARRPLSFYLALQGRYPFQLEPGADRLLEPGRRDAWAIVDEAMLVQEGDSDEMLSRLLGYWRIEATFHTVVDPVTLLDIEPQAAFRSNSRRTFDLWLLSPRIPPVSP